jgi:hypothetical protein
MKGIDFSFRYEGNYNKKPNTADYPYLQTFASNQCGKTEAIIRCTVLTVSGVHTTTPAFAARNDFSATLLALVAPGISL